jgi:cell division protein FtsB
MRRITFVLAALILLLQYPLWFGKGGWLKVWELNREVEAQKQENQKMQARNAVMDAEVRDLKQGSDAIEERARSDLGMIKPGEVYFQLDDAHLPASGPVALPGRAIGARSAVAASNDSGK